MNKFVKFAAACVAAVVGFEAEAYTSASYVQDGLIAQWDGIENAGRGVHDANAATWVDLTGNGCDFPVQAYMGSQLEKWGDNSLVAKSCYQVPCAKSCSDYVTIEICAKHNGQYQCLFNSGDGLKKFVAVMRTSVQFYNAANNNYDIGSGDSFQAAAVHNADGTLLGVYTNGVPAAQTTTDTWGGNTAGTCLGRGANNYQFTGEYYAIRLYNRALTPDELAKNAKIDAVRYFGAVYSDSLEISGAPIDIDAVSPANGTVNDLEVGATLPCSAPAVWTNAEETVAATCLGYKVYTNDVVYMEGAANSFTYVHPDCESGAQLVWQWGLEYKVSASVNPLNDGASGSVSPAAQWVKSGEDAEIVFSVGENCDVEKVTGGECRDGKIVVSGVTSPVTVVADIGVPVLKAGLKGGVVNSTALDVENDPVEELTSMGYLSLVAANTRTTSAGNWADSLDPVWTRNRTWVYWGEMWFDGGVYRFGANLYDQALVKIDGETVWTSAGNVDNCSEQVRPSRGWHAVEFRFFNGNDANAGPRGTQDSWAETFGFGMNVVDPDVPSYFGRRFVPLADDGTGSLFRHAEYSGTATATAVHERTGSHTLAFAAGEGGAVSTAGGDCAFDGTLTVTATPNSGYRFVKWTGDVAEGQTYAATVAVPGNRDRSITAVFEPDEVRTEKTFVGANAALWSVDENWDPAGVPGPMDDVVIPASKTVELDCLADIGSLTINDKACVSANFASGKLSTLARDALNQTDAIDFGILSRGDVTLYGTAKLYIGGQYQKGRSILSVKGDLSLEGTATELALYSAPTNGVRAQFQEGGSRITVGGEMRIASGNKVYPYSCSTTGRSTVFDVHKLTLAAGGEINVVGAAYYYKCPYQPAALDTGKYLTDGGHAGSHRGKGGEGCVPYDFELAPFYPGHSGNAAPGSGVVRIYADEVALAGTINAAGKVGTTASGGGAVWITCESFAAASTAQILAQGMSSGRGGSGGGGVAIGLKVKPWQIDELYRRGGCENLKVGAVSDILPDVFTVNVDGAVGCQNTGLAGSAVAYLGVNGADTVTLQVATDVPAGAQLAATPKLGMHEYERNAEVSASIVSPALVSLDGQTRMTVSGWTLRWADGTEQSGDGTSIASLALRESAVLTWRLTDREQTVDASATPYGDVAGTVSVNGGGNVGWIDEGTTATLAATPGDAATWEFQYWLGDVPYTNRYDNPLVLKADAAKKVVPFFGRKEGGVCTFKDADGNWYDVGCWTEGVIPGTNDTAVAVGTKGKRKVRVPVFFAVRNLAVTNDYLMLGVTDANIGSQSDYCLDNDGVKSIYLPAASVDTARLEPIGFDVGGELSVGATGFLYAGGTSQSCPTKLSVGGALSLDGYAAVSAGLAITNDFTQLAQGQTISIDSREMFAGANEFTVGGETTVGGTLHVLNESRGGAAVRLRMQKVTVAASGRITGVAGGYNRFTINNRQYAGCPGGMVTSDNYGGGTHAGRGGQANPNALMASPLVYGFANAPFYPGYCNGSGSCRGGATIRLDATELVLDGSIVSTGGRGNKGGGAGGSIWINAGKYEFGDAALVSVAGGNASNGGGGGAGRAALCEGLTDEQMEQLLASDEHTADDISVSELADKLGAKFSAAGGLLAGANRTAGEPGTGVYIVNTAGKVTLTVSGTPSNLGTSVPDYGVQVVATGTEISYQAPEDATITEDGLTRRRCVGVTIAEASGNIVYEGPETSGSFEIADDTTIVWDFTTIEHALEIGAAEGGSLVCEAGYDPNARWYVGGTSVRVTAEPDDGFVFVGWGGDVEPENLYGETLAFTAEFGRNVTAVFASAAAGAVTWTGEGDGVSWSDKANWSIDAIPGPNADVTIPAGANVEASGGFLWPVRSLVVEAGASVVCCPEGTFTTRTVNPDDEGATRLVDWQDSGIVAGGDITVGGSLTAGRENSLSRAGVVAGGNLTVAEGATLNLFGGYKALYWNSPVADWRDGRGLLSAGGKMTISGTANVRGEGLSGSPIEVRAASLTIPEGGLLNAEGGGWFWTEHNTVKVSRSPLGTPGDGGWAAGTYGGYSLYNTNKKPYGEALSPYLPGSCGENNGGANRGGAALRITVAGTLRLDGTINANGKQAGGAQGGGAGGGIWIVCNRLKSAETARLTADGGGSTGDATWCGGGAGGGRILICERLKPEQVDELYASATVSDRKTVVSEITDDNVSEFFAGILTAKGGETPARPDRAGTDGTVRWVAGPKIGFQLIVR